MPVGKAASNPAALSSHLSPCPLPRVQMPLGFLTGWLPAVYEASRGVSRVPVMRWKGISGTTLVVSLLFHTDVDSAVYTVLTRETDTGPAVRLGLWRRRPHTPTDVCLRGRLLRSSACTMVPKAGQAGASRTRPCRAHHRKSKRSGSLGLLLHEEGKSPH